MFKDCKTGGYNLEKSHADNQRLNSLILLIAIAYTWTPPSGSNNRHIAKKIYVIIRGFKFNPLEVTHNCKLLTKDYNADHNGDGDSDNDSTIF